jgi:hypothetical protein
LFFELVCTKAGDFGTAKAELTLVTISQNNGVPQVAEEAGG